MSREGIVAMLLEAGSELNVESGAGYTPFAMANDWGTSRIADMLRLWGCTRFAEQTPVPTRVVQIAFCRDEDARLFVTCSGMDGSELYKAAVESSTSVLEFCEQLTQAPNRTEVQSSAAILPNGVSLASIEPSTAVHTLANV